MSLFTIDKEKCTHCSICAKECPTQVIKYASKESLPSPVKHAEQSCIECGHCMSICPSKAFTLASMKPENYTVIKKNQLPKEINISEFLKSRRSIRIFKNKAISHEILNDLIDITRYAPTGSNKQKVQWTVFEKAEDVKNLSSLVIDWTKLVANKLPNKSAGKLMAKISSSWDKGKDRILHKSPHLIVVHAKADLPSIQADCIIALTYLELYATAKGIGTCWAGFLSMAANNHKPLTKALKIPQGHKCFGAVMIGYPQYQYNHIPERKKPSISWQ